jgi:hypothetical protein
MSETLMRRVVTALLVLVAAFAACEPRVGDIEDSYTPGGPTVVVIGDSLTSGGRVFLHDALRPVAAAKIAGLAGSTFAKMTPYAETYAPDVPTVAVIALGTNDRQPIWNLDTSLAALNHMYDLYPDTCTVGVTVTTHHTREDLNAKAVILNDAATARADLMFDWDTVAAEPGMTQVDEVHPTPEGHLRRAALIAGAVGTCQPVP